MKKLLLSVFISALLFAILTFGFSVTAIAESETTVSSTTASSTQTTVERTDDDPFANNNTPADKETPTFYYILGGLAGVVIIFAVAGFVTSIRKK